jgi:hypothetical protein
VKDDFAQGLKEQHEAMIELGTRPMQEQSNFCPDKAKSYDFVHSQVFNL